MKKDSLGKFWNVAHLEDEEGEDLEIRGYRRLQQEWERGEWVDGEGWTKNKFTLGTERCENIKNLYISTSNIYLPTLVLY